MDPRTRRRQRGYGALLFICLAVMTSLMLPLGWRLLAAVGYLALPVVLIMALGEAIGHGKWALLHKHLYRSLGVCTWIASLVWFLTPLSEQGTGVPLLVLWAALAIWSCERLIRNLALERSINREVLAGAVAGYLLLGLAAGLLFNALETMLPGSFLIDGMQADGAGVAGMPGHRVEATAFVQLNYFAFVTLTTTGYGDLQPLTPQTQMLCVLVAIAGTVYLAMVMGLLISRYSARDEH